MTKYPVKATTQFKKDYTLAIKRGLKMDLLEQIIASLADDIALPDKNKDHALKGIGQGIESATSCPISYSFTALMAMSLF